MQRTAEIIKRTNTDKDRITATTISMIEDTDIKTKTFFN